MAESIFYTSRDHKRRWLTAMLTSGKVYDGKLDPQYGAALYILTADADIWQQAQPYVDRDGINIPTLLKEAHFSSGYRVLVLLAGNLFNSQVHLDPIELVLLDDIHFNVALTTFQIRHVSWPLDELATKAEIYNIEMDIRNRIVAENREKPWLPFVDGE